MEEYNYLIHNIQYHGKSWTEFQAALMEVVKSFPDEYKMGNIDEQQKTIEIKIVKVPFDDGINVRVDCKPVERNISVDFNINDADIPSIKKDEAKNLGEELAGNIYYSFSKTLHLFAKSGPLKEKREQQETMGGGVFSFIILIISIIVIFY